MYPCWKIILAIWIYIALPFFSSKLNLLWLVPCLQRKFAFITQSQRPGEQLALMWKIQFFSLCPALSPPLISFLYFFHVFSPSASFSPSCFFFHVFSPSPPLCLSPSPSLLLWLLPSLHLLNLSPSSFPFSCSRHLCSPPLSSSFSPFVLGWRDAHLFLCCSLLSMAAPIKKISGKNLGNS